MRLPSIAAASIFAKCNRDLHMIKMNKFIKGMDLILIWVMEQIFIKSKSIRSVYVKFTGKLLSQCPVYNPYNVISYQFKLFFNLIPKSFS